MARVRSFDARELEGYFSKNAVMSYELGKGIRGSGLQFTVFLPRARILPEEPEEVICDDRDELLLRTLLEGHFGGCTVDTAFLEGAGYREGTPETNIHRKITVITSPSPEAQTYFNALGKELEMCSGEEQVLITWQNIVIV